MYLSKKVKSVLLSTILALGLTASITANVSAYTPETAVYTTVSGDSLFKVSQVFHTTVDNLMNENNLKTSSLNIGQVLRVPGDIYTVQKGDTLFLISQKYKMQITDLQRANNIYTDKLDIGQRLAVPVPASVTKTPAPMPAETTAYSAADLDLLSRLIMAEA
ncbi:MAG TPA: LysM peptidoglycan-binding domain-containing protein, partial [Anaerovoracaceae bacterium]|nr:LysM peptidoglycan-binding domain-containing protein [Anaerovoracaceae bacterium]